jgi:hypothetical protein
MPDVETSSADARAKAARLGIVVLPRTGAVRPTITAKLRWAVNQLLVAAPESLLHPRRSDRRGPV